jgi:hypothetical protein
MRYLCNVTGCDVTIQSVNAYVQLSKIVYIFECGFARRLAGKAFRVNNSPGLIWSTSWAVSSRTKDNNNITMYWNIPKKVKCALGVRFPARGVIG